MEVTQHTEFFSAFTCIALMVGMLVAAALGHRAGIKQHRTDPSGARTISGAAEAAVFALLGLLIAFTFDGASDRFEERRTLITEEANAIDTAWRNLDLLADADRAVLRTDIRDFLDARLDYYANLSNPAAATINYERAEQLEAALWSHLMEALPRVAAPGGTIVLLTSIHRVFEVTAMRKMASVTHPPLAIYSLLMFLALICATLAGHHAAPSAKHPWVMPLLFAGVSSLAIFVTLDLEYPRAGLIRIDSADFLLREVRKRM